MADRLLLVEGEADCSFFKQFFTAQAILAGITVAPPVEVGGRKNTKQGVLNHLDTLIPLLDQEGSYQALAIVVDADLVADGGGFQNTIRQISKKVEAYGYDTPPEFLAKGGLLYKNSDGLPDFGAWVMPDNTSEGMLEDWIKQSVSPAESALLTQAQSTVASLAAPKFKANHLSKAEVATWLAWQKKPGEGLYYAVEGNLLDTTAMLHVGLLEWLKTVFP